MTYTSGLLVSSEHIGPYSAEGMDSFNHWNDWTNGSSPASSTFGQNVVFYYPILLSGVATIRRMFVLNGSTANGNLDMGIYRPNVDGAPDTLVASTGSTAQSGTNAVQYVDITDTTLAPGLWFFAITSNSATATSFRTTGIGGVTGRNVVSRQASTFPLPSSAAPDTAGGGIALVFGGTQRATP